MKEHVGVWLLDEQVVDTRIALAADGRGVTVQAQHAPTAAQPTLHTLKVAFAGDQKLLRVALQTQLAWNANNNGFYYLADAWQVRLDYKPRKM